MSSARTGAMKLMGLMLVGGFMTGGLMAMTTPTQMKREVGNWRQAIGVREVTASEPTIPVYSPPEDLTPVHWLPAAEEYAYTPTPEPRVDTTTDLMPDAVDDDGHATLEMLPPEILAGRTTGPAKDETITTVNAARSTADDAQTVESTTNIAASEAAPAPQEIVGTT
jgi:hypothetical protein